MLYENEGLGKAVKAARIEGLGGYAANWLAESGARI